MGGGGPAVCAVPLVCGGGEQLFSEWNLQKDLPMKHFSSSGGLVSRQITAVFFLCARNPSWSLQSDYIPL